MTPQLTVRPWEARRLHPQFLSAEAEYPSLQSRVRHNDLPLATGKPKLLDQVRTVMRLRHYSPRTEKTYVHWIKRFIFFHGKRHPGEMREAEVGQFLSFLATDAHVSASTQNQALNAILFLYRDVLEIPISYINGVVRAKRPQRLPVVLSRQEVKALLSFLEGTEWLRRCCCTGLDSA